MPSHFRPLLPNPQQIVRNGLDAQGQNQGRRVTIAAACEACRKRKSRCSGERPRCAVCVERGSPCEYSTLPTETHLKAQKRKLSDLELRCQIYEELFDVLQSCPEDTVAQVLHRIRAGEDVEAVVKAIRDSDLLIQLALQPEFRFRHEFPYLDNMPPFLGQHPNPHLHSILYDKLRDLSPHEVMTTDLLRSIDDEKDRMYLSPYYAVRLADPRISVVDASRWTAVITDNTLLQELLEIYFVFEYPFHTYFHKDLFLEDMVNGRPRFCSRLLVNAVLAAAWHGYGQTKDRAEYWRPESYGYRFLAEARRLLDLESADPTITTVQAAAIMNLTYTVNGTDEMGWKYLQTSLELAKQLDLFSGNADGGKEWQVVAAVTAWGLFNWQAFATWHNFRLPLLPDPPAHPLPDVDPGTDHYGETFLRYPHARHPVSASHGATFRAISRLCVIINDAGKQAWASPRDHSWDTLNSALAIKSRLVEWHEGLPESLTAKNIVLPCHLKLHVQYHVLLISLFEPLIELSTPPGVESVESIIAHSRACFEALIRIYYLRHGFESYDPTLFHFLPLLAYGTLKDMRVAERGSQNYELMRSTLVLCAKGLWSQGRCYYIAEAILRVLMESAGPEDAKLIGKFTEIEEANNHMSHMAQEIRSRWPIGVFSFPGEGEYLTLTHFIRWWEANRMA